MAYAQDEFGSDLTAWKPKETGWGQPWTPTPKEPAVDMNELIWRLGTPVEKGGLSAADLEEMIHQLKITPEAANAALIEKDRWLHSQRQSQGGASPSSWGGWPGYWPAAYGANQVPSQAMEFNPWRLTPLQGMYGTPLRNFELPDVTMRGIPEAERSNIMAWLRRTGWRPTGSLGQFGFRSFETNSPYTFSDESFENIPDAGLKAWAKWLFGRAPAPTYP